MLLYDSEMTPALFDSLIPSLESSFTFAKKYEHATSLYGSKEKNTVSMEIAEAPEKQSKIKEGGTPTPINQSNKLFNAFPKNTYERIYIGSPERSLELLRDIYNTYNTPTPLIDVKDVRRMIVDLYEEFNANYPDTFIKFVKKQGKVKIAKKIGLGDKFEQIVVNDDFYITNLDIWMFATKYEIPVVLLSNNPNGLNENNMHLLTLHKNSDEQYIFISAAARKMNESSRYSIFEK